MSRDFTMRVIPWLLALSTGVALSGCYRSSFGLRGVAGLGETMVRGDRQAEEAAIVLPPAIDAFMSFESPNDEQLVQPTWGMELSLRGGGALGAVVHPLQGKFIPTMDAKTTYKFLLCGAYDGKNTKVLTAGFERHVWSCVTASVADFKEAAAVAAKRRVPLVLDPGLDLVARSAPPAVDEVARKYPQLKLVVARLGGPWSVEAAKWVAKFPNVYVDTAFVTSPDANTRAVRDSRDALAKRLAPFAPYPKKVILASGWPKSLFQVALDAVQVVFPQKEWGAIFSGNANEVYRFGFDAKALEVSLGEGRKKPNPDSTH